MIDCCGASRKSAPIKAVDLPVDVPARNMYHFGKLAFMYFMLMYRRIRSTGFAVFVSFTSYESFGFT